MSKNKMQLYWIIIWKIPPANTILETKTGVFSLRSKISIMRFEMQRCAIYYYHTVCLVLSRFRYFNELNRINEIILSYNHSSYIVKWFISFFTISKQYVITVTLYWRRAICYITWTKGKIEKESYDKKYADTRRRSFHVQLIFLVMSNRIKIESWCCCCARVKFNLFGIGITLYKQIYYLSTM